jgi:hypothetical protein
MLKTTGINQIDNFKNKKMQTKKISLANIQAKLSRAEMKKIMAGSGNNCQSTCDGSCSYRCSGDSYDRYGRCGWSGSTCTCASAC